ncbi:hypothetical protein ABK040_001037 [Willaertia magna]
MLTVSPTNSIVGIPTTAAKVQSGIKRTCSSSFINVPLPSSLSSSCWNEEQTTTNPLIIPMITPKKTNIPEIPNIKVIHKNAKKTVNGNSSTTLKPSTSVCRKLNFE